MAIDTGPIILTPNEAAAIWNAELPPGEYVAALSVTPPLTGVLECQDPAYGRQRFRIGGEPREHEMRFDGLSDETTIYAMVILDNAQGEPVALYALRPG